MTDDVRDPEARSTDEEPGSPAEDPEGAGEEAPDEVLEDEAAEAGEVPEASEATQLRNSLAGDTFLRFDGRLRFVEAVRGLSAENLGRTLLRAPLPKGRVLAVVSVHAMDPETRGYGEVARIPLHVLGPEAAHCLVVGRWPSSDIHLDDPHVSRYHGVLAARPSAGSAPLILFRDVGTFRTGSTNGTVVNGDARVVDEMVPLAIGDELEVGYRDGLRSHRIRVEAAGESV